MQLLALKTMQGLRKESIELQLCFIYSFYAFKAQWVKILTLRHFLIFSINSTDSRDICFACNNYLAVFGLNVSDWDLIWVFLWGNKLQGGNIVAGESISPFNMTLRCSRYDSLFPKHSDLYLDRCLRLIKP